MPSRDPISEAGNFRGCFRSTLDLHASRTTLQCTCILSVLKRLQHCNALSFAQKLKQEDSSATQGLLKNKTNKQTNATRYVLPRWHRDISRVFHFQPLLMERVGHWNYGQTSAQTLYPKSLCPTPRTHCGGMWASKDWGNSVYMALLISARTPVSMGFAHRLLLNRKPCLLLRTLPWGSPVQFYHTIMASLCACPVRNCM